MIIINLFALNIVAFGGKDIKKADKEKSIYTKEEIQKIIDEPDSIPPFIRHWKSGSDFIGNTHPRIPFTSLGNELSMFTKTRTAKVEKSLCDYLERYM